MATVADTKLTSTIQLSLAFFIFYVVVTLIRFSLKSLRPKNYPPGPPALPFIGNLHQFGSTKPALKFTELQRIYGDILGLKAGPGNLVVINSAKLFRELFDKRWIVYSGRPNDYIPRELIVRGAQHIIFLPNDAYLRQWRTSVRHLLGHDGCEGARPVQEAAALHLAYSLIQEPTELQKHMRTWSLVTPMVAICGYQSPHKDSRLIRWFFENQHDWLDLLTPGVAPPVDIFPILKYIPEFMAKWKRKARNVHKNQKGFYQMMLESAKRQESLIGSGNERDTYECLMAKLLRERKDSKTALDDSQLMYLGGGLLDAAVDTTYSAALTILKVFAAMPDVFKRAQDEIDDVCGSQSPPGSEHIPSLKFTRACYLEVLRWRPPTPSTLPHLMEKDDTVNGYFIPKGTVVLGNAWSVQHDPEAFQSPDIFDPERFLRNPYGTKETAEEAQLQGRKYLYCFGSGRRQCPGDLFAEGSIMITLAKLIWAFDIIADETIDLSIENGFHGGLVWSSQPYKVHFVSRSAHTKQKITEEYERCKCVLD